MNPALLISQSTFLQCSTVQTFIICNTVAPKYTFSSLHHLFSSLHHLFSSPYHLFSLHNLFSSKHHLFSSLHHLFSSPYHLFSSLHHLFSSLHHLFEKKGMWRRENFVLWGLCIFSGSVCTGRGGGREKGPGEKGEDDTPPWELEF